LPALSNKRLKRIEFIYDQIVEEYNGTELMKFQKIASQLNILYIEISRFYLQGTVTAKRKQTQIAQVRKLESLIDLNFKNVKFPKDYAEMMFISDKHLNRISKATLNKTTSDLISDRIILEAKRMLMYGSLSVSEIAFELGYGDNSYFFRMFKKKTGQTPLEFLREHRKTQIL
jgi:AraC family transcriptional regulator, transcriptional activator of pobA